MAASTEEVELTAPFHQNNPSETTSLASSSKSAKKKAKKISKQLKGLVSEGLIDDPFGNITFSDEEEDEEDNFAIDKILKQTKNKVPVNSHFYLLALDSSTWY